MVDILWLRPGRGRGVLTGIAMAIKLTPAVFLAVFFVRREWRAFFSALGSFLAAGLIAFASAAGNNVTSWYGNPRNSYMKCILRSDQLDADFTRRNCRS